MAVDALPGPLALRRVHRAALAQVNPAVGVHCIAVAAGQQVARVGGVAGDGHPLAVGDAVEELVGKDGVTPEVDVIADIAVHCGGSQGRHLETEIHRGELASGVRVNRAVVLADVGGVRAAHARAAEVDLGKDDGKGRHLVASCHGGRVIVHRGGDDGVHGVGGIGHVGDLEIVGGTAVQHQPRVGERDQQLAVLRLHGGLGVVQHAVGGHSGPGGAVAGHLLRPARAQIAPVEADTAVEGGGQLVDGLLPLGGCGGIFHRLIQRQETLAAVLHCGADILAEFQDNIRVRHGIGGVVQAGVFGEILLDNRPVGVQGVDGHLDHGDRVVARLILGYIVEVIGGFRLQAGNGEIAVYALPGVDLPVAQGVEAGRHLQNRVFIGQQDVCLAGAGLGELGPCGDHGPVDDTVLIEPEGQADAGGLDVVDRGVDQEFRRRLIHGGKGQADDGGAVGPVGVGEPEVEHVGLLLLQGHVVDKEHVLQVLRHLPHAVAQRAGDGAGLQLVGSGRLGPLSHQGIVEDTALGGHDRHLAAVGLDAGHVGVAGAEGGDRVVRQGEGDHLGGAALVPLVHQHGGQVVGPAGRQAADGRRHLRVALGGGGGAAAHGNGAVGGGLNEVVRTHGAVGDGADSPVDGAALIGGEYRLQGVGGNILRPGITGEDQGLLGGLLRSHVVHFLAVDGGGDTGADGNLVGEHGDGGAGGVDHQLLNVALAGDAGAYVQIQLLDHRAAVDDDRRIHGGLVHRQLGDGALGGPDLGLRGFVDDLTDSARQVQLDGLVRVLVLLVVGPALQGDVLQSQALGGVVLHIGAGAHGGGADLRDAVGPDGDKVALEVIHQHLVRRHVAQHDTGLAGLALAGAADNDAAQDGDVLQLHVAKAHAASDVQVAADDGIPQRHAGG